MDNLIEPILRQRQLGLAPDARYTIGQVCDRWRDQPTTVLANAVAIVITERKAVVKPADIDDAMRRAVDADKTARFVLEHQRQKQQSTQVCTTRNLIVLQPGTEAWHAHVRDAPLNAFGKARDPTKIIKVRR